MSLISIVTRHIPSRGEGFERLVKSLLAQTSQDYQHLVIRNEPLGLLDANQSLARHKDEVTGDYVLIVDDDDYVSDPCFVERFRGFAVSYCEIIMLRFIFMGAIFPDDKEWNRLIFGGHPQHTKIGCPNYAIRRDVWLDCIDAFGTPDSGDYHFITKCYENPENSVMFTDLISVTVDHIGKDEHNAH